MIDHSVYLKQKAKTQTLVTLQDVATLTIVNKHIVRFSGRICSMSVYNPMKFMGQMSLHIIKADFHSAFMTGCISFGCESKSKGGGVTVSETNNCFTVYLLNNGIVCAHAAAITLKPLDAVDHSAI